MCHCFGKKDHQHLHLTVQVTILHATTTTTTTTTTTAQNIMHAFSICTTALGKRPPPLPSHSASYNIMANHRYYHCHHLDHHSTNYNACIQYMCHCFRKKTDHQCKLQWAWSSTSTLQTTACAKDYVRTVVEDKDHQRKLQRVKNYTATIGVHDAASTCNLHKGMPLNFCPYPQFNGMWSYNAHKV